MTRSGGCTEATDAGTSGSVSKLEWYHASTGTTHTPLFFARDPRWIAASGGGARSFGRVCTPHSSHRRRTRSSLAMESREEAPEEEAPEAPLRLIHRSWFPGT